MALNLISPDREQAFLLPPSLRDWMPEGDYVWFILDAIAKMNLSPFMGGFRLDGRGGALYDPTMMVGLLVYSYSLGIHSSRKIEQLCERDIAFRIICGNLKPDHSSIARFRQNHEDEFATLFLQVLNLCREAKLTRAGIIALDGTKMSGNASLGANRTKETLQAEVEKAMAEAKAKDAQEDLQFGDKRGDELPRDLQDSRSRKTRIDECLRRIAEEEAAKGAEHEALLQKRKEREAAGEKIRGRKPKEEKESKPIKANTTDPESRIMKSAKGYLQGYNAQAVANEHQIIIAAEVTQDQNDQRQFHPMVKKAVENLQATGGKTPKVALADAGYASEAVLSTPAPQGIEPIMATKKDSVERTTSVSAPRGRIPKKASARERMSRKTSTKRGKALYLRRGQIIEPVFGQIKSGQGISGFSRRGKSACDSEWKLICATHNLLKLWRKGKKTEEEGLTIH